MRTARVSARITARPSSGFKSLSRALFGEFKCAASESWTPPASLPLGFPAGQSPLSASLLLPKRSSHASMLWYPFLGAVAHGSAAAWRHFNLLGEYDFSEEKLQDGIRDSAPKIDELNGVLFWG